MEETSDSVKDPKGIQKMEIKNSNKNDIQTIFKLYRVATEYMKSKNQVFWPEFPKELIETEIAEKRQWKLVIEDQIVCIWATALSDELIWGEENNAPSVYIHRIAANPNLRGQNFVKKIVDWADDYCKNNDLRYVRMDTIGHNQGLINHYTKYGFDHIGTRQLEVTDGLPDHYNDGDAYLFQREVRK